MHSSSHLKGPHSREKNQEDSTDLTMKSAIDALEENDVSDKSMRYLVI